MSEELKAKRKHPEWCNYPVLGKWSETVDMCWEFRCDRNIKKDKCVGCEHLKEIK